MHLKPDFVEAIRAQQRAREASSPEGIWQPTRSAEGIAQTIRNSCPRMAGLMEEAGILEAWSEDLYAKVTRVAVESYRYLAANEAESVARIELIPCSWEQQEAFLEAHCENYEPASDPDLCDPEAENEKDDGALGSFSLGADEREQVATLVQILGCALARPGLQPREIALLACFKWLLNAFPDHSPYTGSLNLIDESGDQVSIWQISVLEENLVATCQSTQNEGQMVVLVDITRYREDSKEDPAAADHLRTFRARAADPSHQIEVDWFPKESIPAFLR